MAIALTLQQYLSDHGIDYELMTHELTKSASETAQASHAPADRLAKGGVPPLGAAYALECIVDENLEGEGDVYLEGGDHRTLIHVTGQQFHDLMRDAPHGHICGEA